MDGIDSMAGGQVSFCAAWLVIGALSSQKTVACVGLLACASLGFLKHNWPPADVFMGHVGSAFLGFHIRGHRRRCRAESSAASADIHSPLWPFVFDTAFTFSRRPLRREGTHGPPVASVPAAGLGGTVASPGYVDVRRAGAAGGVCVAVGLRDAPRRCRSRSAVADMLRWVYVVRVECRVSVVAAASQRLALGRDSASIPVRERSLGLPGGIASRFATS
jgi:hypothetical protein